MEVRFEQVSKQYRGQYALRDFSVTLQEGVYGLLGTNGAGKTTLLNLFLGILKGDGGRIYINGEDIRRLGADFLNEIGYLPQYPRFYRDFTAEEFLRYMCAVKDIPEGERAGRISRLLESTNLTEARHKRVGALSGGMRQRLGIAQAMLNDPHILILDEPTAGLDPQERIRFRNLISRFAEGRIVILATHIVSDVEFIANQIILLKEGRLIRLGSPAALTEELSGMLWSLSLAERDVPEELLHTRITNLMRVEGGIRLRILAGEQPHPAAVPAPPTLEEAFLYYCGESGL